MNKAQNFRRFATRGARHRRDPIFRSVRVLAAVAMVAAMLPLTRPALAQPLSELKLCPPGVVKTCYIGYVTSVSTMIVLLSSMDNNSLVGDEVEVDRSPPSASVRTLDLSKQIGRVVMLDATGADHIFAARIVSVADPLLTALYVSTFLMSSTNAPAPE